MASTTAEEILSRGFYQRPVLKVARDLLGMHLVRELPRPRGRARRPPALLVGRIVEVEAYDGTRDAACHASRGRTARTEPMFGPAGHAYIYFIYGKHCCLNVVTGDEGYPAAVLIRAVEPLGGIERMRPGWGRVMKPAHLASGPGRLTRAFHIDLSLNRADLCAPGPVRIVEGERVTPRKVVRGPRIGVDYAGVWAGKPWRLGIRDHIALSRKFPAPAR